MTEISIDRDVMVSLFTKLESRGDQLRSAISAAPPAADAGEASAELGVIVVAINELAEKVQIAVKALTEVGLDVADDLLAGDEHAADVFTRMEGLSFS
ncbi:hypothetical protein [Leucobacter manosquensis]|uniref:Uncharacterized protein n=1 Tax=Leucobacter manosquensis TaxID=2810611 RepID=A0ABS5M8M5_9MICO|nr:hypothetical protein [Leucobacter manosquensis]MBS3183001.1 hypothetical protein [Leucobacter manosquensis]